MEYLNKIGRSVKNAVTEVSNKVTGFFKKSKADGGRRKSAKKTNIGNMFDGRRKKYRTPKKRTGRKTRRTSRKH